MRYLKVMFGNKSNANGTGFEYKIGEVNIANNWNPNATDPKEMGGFNFSVEDKILRWLVRGDTIYDIEVPEDAEIIDVLHPSTPHGVFRANKIIILNPRKVTDEMAMEFYKKCTIPKKSYYKAMAGCAIRGYMNTALQILEDKVNYENIDLVLEEFKDFCTHNDTGIFNEEELGNNAKRIYELLLQIKNDSKYNMKKRRKVGPFTWIYELKNKKFVRKYKRKGLHAYLRTVPEKHISNLLNNTKILHPKIYRNRIKYIDEEFIECDKGINEIDKEKLVDTIIGYITEMNNVNCKKIEKFIKWKNNSEYLKFQVENLKKVLIDRKCNMLSENIKALDEFIVNLDDDRKLSLIHGDMHLKNMIVNNRGIYFIDWEMATYGDIAYEIAMHFVLMQYNESEKNKFIDKVCKNISLNKQNLINDIKVYEKFEEFRKNILNAILNNEHHHGHGQVGMLKYYE